MSVCMPLRTGQTDKTEAKSSMGKISPSQTANQQDFFLSFFFLKIHYWDQAGGMYGHLAFCCNLLQSETTYLVFLG